MLELTFIAYIISLISLVVNLWLWYEVNELKRLRKRDNARKRLESVVKTTQPSKRGPWGY